MEPLPPRQVVEQALAAMHIKDVEKEMEAAIDALVQSSMPSSSTDALPPAIVEHLDASWHSLFHEVTSASAVREAHANLLRATYREMFKRLLPSRTSVDATVDNRPDDIPDEEQHPVPQDPPDIPGKTTVRVTRKAW